MGGGGGKGVEVDVGEVNDGERGEGQGVFGVGYGCYEICAGLRGGFVRGWLMVLRRGMGLEDVIGRAMKGSFGRGKQYGNNAHHRSPAHQ